MKIETELMRGAGPTAVLGLLAGGERYAYELIELLDRRTEGVLAMGQSTLYPLLYNLEAKGLITSRSEVVAGRSRKYYRLTAKGEKRLSHEKEQWESLTGALAKLGLVGA